MEVDAIVVGLGPGGEAVAGQLAEAGLDVVGIEAALVGGECPYWGCIPSKMIVRGADLLAEARRVRGLAGASSVTPDWWPVARRIRDATDNWDDAVAVERFEGKGGRFVRGRARLVSSNEVEVGGETIRARRALVLATGQRPWIPPLFEGVPHWTNRQAVVTDELPRSLLVAGGGAVGLEIGQAMSRFGVRVTVVELGPRLLASEEPEASALMAKILEREGVEVLTGVQIDSVEPAGDHGVTLRLAGGGGGVTRSRALVATGRRSDLGALGVGVLGLDETAPAIAVDEHLRVAPGVWAVGDTTGKGAFTHVALYQARICAADILGLPHDQADYRAVPRVTFTDPEIGSVGLTEAEARQLGGDITILAEPIADEARGWIHGAEGFIKLVARDGLLVGATSMGPTGGEVLGMLTLAVHGRIPLDTLRSMVYAYPTFHRAVESALLSPPSNASKIAGA
jgi:pyruvate/2-oxoglutarate dehydrogenase complex dihydrolipoamide dehydrogenase (E3) component